MTSSPMMTRHCGGGKLPNSSILSVSVLLLLLNLSIDESFPCVSLVCLNGDVCSQPLGTGQTNLWMPQGVLGQVMSPGEQGYVVRWEYSYSSWTLFTCEVEMLLHVVSTAGT